MFNDESHVGDHELPNQKTYAINNKYLSLATRFDLYIAFLMDVCNRGKTSGIFFLILETWSQKYNAFNSYC